MLIRCDNPKYPEEAYTPEARNLPKPLGRAACCPQDLKPRFECYLKVTSLSQLVPKMVPHSFKDGQAARSLRSGWVAGGPLYNGVFGLARQPPALVNHRVVNHRSSVNRLTG